MSSSLKYSFWRDPLMVAAVVVVVLLILLSVLGPVFITIDPNLVSNAQLSPPTWQHWCGTDFLGRDILVRLLGGARISLLVGLVGALVSLVIGVTWGAVAAYLGGKTDNLMMRVVDVLYSLPSLIFVIVLITVLERPMASILGKLGGISLLSEARLVLLFVGLGCVEWLTMSRVVRGQVLVLKEAQYVQASRVMGQKGIIILWRHILPHLVGLVAVYLTLSIPAVILQESFLSFLGMGVQAPSASLGTLLADGAQVINPIRGAWWMLFFPGLFMALLLLALNFLGDGLRDIMDPRSQGRRN